MRQPTRIGRYEVVELLGRGGMGAVYKAYDPVLDRHVAVKLISPMVSHGPDLDEALERFRREARAAGRLSHPNVVSVYDMDVDQETGSPFIVMEYVDGVSLSTVLSENAVLPVTQALEITEHVGAALVEAHQHGIVHRDIKPGNVFLDARGRVKVGDFGIARIEGSDLTRSGATPGTPGYLAPEVLHGATADTRSDVFSLAVLSYQLLAGRRPFEGSTPTAITFQVLQHVPEAPTALRSEVAPHVSAAVMRALDKSPTTRTASVDTFLRELRGETRPVATRTLAVMPPVRRGNARKLVLATAGGAFVLGVGSLLALRGCASGPGSQFASPRTPRPASVLADDPAPATRPPVPPRRTLSPKATPPRLVEADKPQQGDKPRPRGPRVEDAAATWLRDQVEDVLSGSRPPDDGTREADKKAEERRREEEKKREDKERASRQKERGKEKDGKGKGKGKGR